MRSKVLEFVAAGKSNKEIADFLDITEGTVKVHVNPFAKLGVSGRVAATLFALQCGIVQLPALPAPISGGAGLRKPKSAS